MTTFNSYHLRHNYRILKYFAYISFFFFLPDYFHNRLRNNNSGFKSVFLRAVLWGKNFISTVYTYEICLLIPKQSILILLIHLL